MINIARGSVVDQNALVRALTDKTIAGAGLDVYAKEPHAPDALTALPNVVLSRISGRYAGIPYRDAELHDRQPQAFFAGKPLPYAVGKLGR